MLQFWLASTGVSTVSVEPADVACAALDPAASGTGTATVGASDFATVAIAGVDATIVLGSVAVLPDVATVAVGANDAASNQLIVQPDAATVVGLSDDPVARLWPTRGQRQSLSLDLFYERIHVGESRVRRAPSDDAPRPLRQQEAV